MQNGKAEDDLPGPSDDLKHMARKNGTKSNKDQPKEKMMNGKGGAHKDPARRGREEGKYDYGLSTRVTEMEQEEFMVVDVDAAYQQ